jgi:hypothetical protein
VEVYRKLSITIIYLVLLIDCRAEISYSSTEIKKLFDLLPESLKKEIIMVVSNHPNSSLNSSLNWNSKIIAFKIDNSKIIDIGIQLNGLQVTNNYDSIVKYFIERTLLRLSFNKTISDLVNSAETMQITFYLQDQDLRFGTIKDFDDILTFINTSTHFTLAKNNYLFFAEWKNKEQVLKLKFPNDYQLITGKNKKELDDELFINIGKMLVLNPFPYKTDVGERAIDSFPIPVINGYKFMNLLSSEGYYKKVANDSVLVFDTASIPSSVSNLFLNKQLSGGRTLIITQNLYGQRSITYNISLLKFIGFFETEFTNYIGMEKSEPDLIEGTLVLHNKYFNFMHMVHFRTNSSEFFSNSGNITAEFYTNIPLHNVSDLFKDFKPEKTEQKIDININKP